MLATDDASAPALKPQDGDAAIVELTRFPESADETLEGRLIAVLGTPGDPKVEVRKILMREQIVEEHPPEAMQEAEAMSARLRVLPLEGRRDLRQVPLPTIDPKDARDHDDSVWVEKLDNGYRAYVAIADVSEYVVEGSALDAEARARGCTLYLPDRAVPMLPSALAADLCSLLPDRERFCLCVIVDLDRQGQVESFEIVEGLMRSSAMLTYEGVAAALGFTENGPRSLQAEAMRPGLKHLDELSRKLRKARFARGALELELPEAHVLLNEESGEPEDVVRRATDPGVRRAYQMIEELMLLANELVAQWLSGKKSLAVYRVHTTPDPEKLERLASVAHRLGLEIDPEELTEPKALGRWLRKIADHPRKTALEMLTLRSLKQAAYDIVNVGHFGLASDSYLHFTSPIRRYPDLIVHRLVKDLLRGGRPKNSPDEVENLRNAATLSSQRERASVEVEREVVDLYRARLMQGSVGQTFEGMVTGFGGSGVYVALDNPYVDVLVRFEQLGAEDYELSEDTLAVVGKRSGDRVELGQRITVVIEEASLLRRVTLARRVVAQRAGTTKERASKPDHARPTPSRPKGDRPSPKGDRPSPKGDRPSPKGDRPSPKGDRPSPKGGRPSPKGDRPSPKGDRPSPKGGKPSPKGGKPSPKSNGTAKDSTRPFGGGAQRKKRSK
jgi:ribonuclease R